MSCPCGSQKEYSACCEPYISEKSLAPTPEALMRSRYSAYVKSATQYLKETLAPESRSDFDAASTKKWAESAKWKGLKILSTQKGSLEDKKGTVEFIATYESEGTTLDHHEVSQFRKNDAGKWLFVDGDAHTHKEGEDHNHHKPQTVIRQSPKVGRNDPCVCGSGKKFKKCCGVEVS